MLRLLSLLDNQVVLGSASNWMNFLSAFQMLAADSEINARRYRNQGDMFESIILYILCTIQTIFLAPQVNPSSG